MVSTFDSLSVEAQMQALRHLAKASFTASLGVYAILIARGLISPDEFSAMVQPVIDELEKVPHVGGDSWTVFVDKLAELKGLAATTWKAT